MKQVTYITFLLQYQIFLTFVKDWSVFNVRKFIFCYKIWEISSTHIFTFDPGPSFFISEYLKDTWV
jgi:hypothetical protein